MQRNSIYKQNFPFIDGIGKIEVGQKVVYSYNSYLDSGVEVLVENISDCFVHLSGSVDVYFDGSEAGGRKYKGPCLYSNVGTFKKLRDREALRNKVIRAFDLCTSAKAKEDLIDFSTCVSLAGILESRLIAKGMENSEAGNLLGEAKEILMGHLQRGDNL